MTMTRRDFLKTGALGATMTVLAPAVWSAAPARPARTLVILQLNGGNDAVNTVIPYTDPLYRRLRPTLAIPERDVLPLSETLGLHPAMRALLPLHAKKTLAFVNGVGFPSLDRSHFRCQNVWCSGEESAGSANSAEGAELRRLGWVGRYADLHLRDSASPLSVMSYGAPIATGLYAKNRPAAVVGDLSSLRLMASREDDSALRALYAAPREGPLESIRTHGATAFAAIDEARRGLGKPAAIQYPPTSFGTGLRGVAQLLSANPAVQVVWISAGGFDTHGRQAAAHAALLEDLSTSLAAFERDLETRGLSERVLLLAWSEFGRRIQENSNGGTEHGKGGTVLLLGHSVAGGVYGEAPALASSVDGDLPSPVDFRSVYATVLRKWLGCDPEPVLNGRYPLLGFL
jgi:uncharacterized protein (DUF1501 family)